MAVAVAGAFALPVAALASATNDSIVVAQGGGGDTGASSRQEGVNPPGQASPGKGAMGATAKHGRFDSLDKNHDGFVSRDEAKDASELDTRFSELDANNDGKLSRDEYNALNKSARGATGTGSMSGKASAPGNRALGSAGSGQAEGGGTSSTRK